MSCKYLFLFSYNIILQNKLVILFWFTITLESKILVSSYSLFVRFAIFISFPNVIRN